MRYKTATITKVLDEIGTKVYKKGWRVNSGGCAVYAIIVHDELAKLGIKTKLKVYGHCSQSVTKASEAVINTNTNGDYHVGHFNDNGVELAHIKVLVRGYVVDCESILPTGSSKNYAWYPLAKGYMNPDALRTIANNDIGWNRMFNRKHIEPMRRIIVKG